MSEAHKNTIIIAQHKQDNISIAVEGTTNGDDASEASEANKNINVFEIGITTIPEGVDLLSDQNFDDISLCTFDAIFSAYTTASGHDNLPYWGVPSGAVSGDITCYSLNPYNPDNIYTSGFVDSGINPTAFYDSGHNIQLYNAITKVGEDTNEDLMPYKGLAESRNPLVKNVRSVGLKSPIVLSGWGYDTLGNPVPSGDGGGFHQDAFNDPSLWKSGPVDLRWNDTRKVWSAAGGGGGGSTIFFTIESVEYCSSCYVVASIRSWSSSYGSKSEIENIGVGVYFESDADVGSEQILVYDRGGCFFNEPPEDLIGREGFATLMYHEGTGPCSEIGDPRNQPLWTVLSLCCPTDECS